MRGKEKEIEPFLCWVSWVERERNEKKQRKKRKMGSLQRAMRIRKRETEQEEEQGCVVEEVGYGGGVVFICQMKGRDG